MVAPVNRPQGMAAPNYGRYSQSSYYYPESARRFEENRRLRDDEIRKAQQRAEAKRKAEMKKVRRVLSGVKWCEKGGWENGHPFSAKDPDAETFSRTIKTGKEDDYGNQITKVEDFDICGRCAASSGLFSGSDEKPKATIVGADSESPSAG